MTQYGPPTANEHLRQSVHGSINCINRAPLCCCEGVEITDEVKPSRVGWLIWPALEIGMAVVGVALFLSFRVHAAERDQIVPHEITVLLKDQQPDRRNIFTLGQPYDSREECLNAIVRVKVMVSGARLRCDKVENRRVR